LLIVTSLALLVATVGAFCGPLLTHTSQNQISDYNLCPT
jgi:hypothetical protein